MSYKLTKPYTNKQRADFVVKYNHNNGKKITETQNALYALEDNEYLDESGNVQINPDYEEQKAQEEAQRVALLNLTGADVERAIYKAKGMDFDDIIAFLEAQPLAQDGTAPVDIKALKIELKANNFYRGNPYIDTVGTLLGFTKEQLDEFFETNDYTKLITQTPSETPTEEPETQPTEEPETT